MKAYKTTLEVVADELGSASARTTQGFVANATIIGDW